MTDKTRDDFEAWSLAFCGGMLLDDGNQWAKLAVLAAWQAATLAERERCALVCDHLAKRSFYAYDCADAIREGGAS